MTTVPGVDASDEQYVCPTVTNLNINAESAIKFMKQAIGTLTSYVIKQTKSLVYLILT